MLGQRVAKVMTVMIKMMSLTSFRDGDGDEFVHAYMPMGMGTSMINTRGSVNMLIVNCEDY